MTEPNKNSHFCVNSRNLIFPVFRTYTTQQNKLVGTDLKLFLSKVIPAPLVISVSHDSERKSSGFTRNWQSSPTFAVGDCWKNWELGQINMGEQTSEDMGWDGRRQGLGRLFEKLVDKMLSNGFFLSSFISSFLTSAFAVHSQLMYPFGVVLALLSWQKTWAVRMRS